jgi:hypothetical protein
LDVDQISVINFEYRLAFCKDHPDLLFLQLDKWRDDERSVGQLKNEIEWINKFREMGIKTPKYFKTISSLPNNICKSSMSKFGC